MACPRWVSPEEWPVKFMNEHDYQELVKAAAERDELRRQVDQLMKMLSLYAEQDQCLYDTALEIVNGKDLF